MWQAQQQEQQQNQQANIDSQRQTAQDAAQGQQQLEQLKAQYEQQKTADLSRADKEKIALQGMFAIWQAGIPVPPALEQVQQEIVVNLLGPLFAENRMNAAALQQAAQMHQLMDQQDQQQSAQNQPVNPNQQPQQAQQDQSQNQRHNGRIKNKLWLHRHQSERFTCTCWARRGCKFKFKSGSDLLRWHWCCVCRRKSADYKF